MSGPGYIYRILSHPLDRYGYSARERTMKSEFCFEDSHVRHMMPRGSLI